MGKGNINVLYLFNFFFKSRGQIIPASLMSTCHFKRCFYRKCCCSKHAAQTKVYSYYRLWRTFGWTVLCVSCWMLDILPLGQGTQPTYLCMCRSTVTLTTLSAYLIINPSICLYILSHHFSIYLYCCDIWDPAYTQLPTSRARVMHGKAWEVGARLSLARHSCITKADLKLHLASTKCRICVGLPFFWLRGCFSARWVYGEVQKRYSAHFQTSSNSPNWCQRFKKKKEIPHTHTHKKNPSFLFLFFSLTFGFQTFVPQPCALLVSRC